MKTISEKTFLDWLDGASIYVGWCRYSTPGPGWICASRYEDSDDLRGWIDDLQSGDSDMFEANEKLLQSDAWWACAPSPVAAMEGLLAKMRAYYRDVLNPGNPWVDA